MSGILDNENILMSDSLSGKKEYISLREASELSGYHADHIGRLIREGKLYGRRTGRGWATTRSALAHYTSGNQSLAPQAPIFVSPEYISLREASELSGYHADHISRLIRQGSLYGKREGRGWTTTRLALTHYLNGNEELARQEVGVGPQLATSIVAPVSMFEEPVVADATAPAPTGALVQNSADGGYEEVAPVSTPHTQEQPFIAPGPASPTRHSYSSARALGILLAAPVAGILLSVGTLSLLGNVPAADSLNQLANRVKGVVESASNIAFLQDYGAEFATLNTKLDAVGTGVEELLGRTPSVIREEVALTEVTNNITQHLTNLTQENITQEVSDEHILATIEGNDLAGLSVAGRSDLTNVNVEGRLAVDGTLAVASTLSARSISAGGIEVGNITVSDSAVLAGDIELGGTLATVAITSSNWNISVAGVADFTQLTVDNIHLDGNTLSSLEGGITFTPLADQNAAFSLAGAGNFIVNTDDLVVDTATGNVSLAGQLQLPTSGSTAGILLGTDVALYRTAANRLNLGDDDILTFPGRDEEDDVLLETAVAGDPFYRFQITAGGTLAWGDGTATRDTNLYRDDVNTLATDDSFDVGGDLTVSGNLSVFGITASNGDIILGDAVTDTITFTGVVNSDITPETSTTYDLGSPSRRWAAGYFDTITANTLTGVVAGGATTSQDWTINSDNASANAELSTLSFETGTGDFNSTLQWNAAGDAGRVTGFDDTFLFNHPIALYSEVSGGNETFTSGTLFSYSQPAAHAITQSGELTGINVDFSSNITVPNSFAGDQWGMKIHLKDGGGAAIAIGLALEGTMDYGIDLSTATFGNAAIRLPSGTTESDGIDFGGDVNLYRSAAGVLRTDSNLSVGGTINGQTISNAASFTGTLGVTTSVTSPSFIGDLTGTAGTATALQTARTLWGQSFDGTGDISGALSGVSDIGMSGTLTLGGDVALSRGAANRLDLGSGDDLYITNGRVGIGSAPINGAALVVHQNVSHTSDAGLLQLSGDVTTTGSTNGIRYLAAGGGFGGSLTINSGNTHSIASTVHLSEPDIILTSGSVTNAATLYISGSPTEGANNYALFVDAGDARVDGQLQLPTTGSSAGLLIGGDVQLYRSAANVLTVPDQLTISNGNLLFGGTGVALGASDAGIRNTGGGGLFLQAVSSMNFTVDPANALTNSAFTFWTDGAEVSGTALATLTDEGLWALNTTGSTGGLNIGTDTHLYRGAANRLDLASGDSLNIVGGNLSIDTGSGRFNIQDYTEPAGGASAALIPTVQRGVIIKEREDMNGGLWLYGGSSNGGVGSRGAIGAGVGGDNATVYAFSTSASMIRFWDGDIQFRGQTGLSTGATVTPDLVGTITSAGQLQLPTTGSSAGLLVGGDTQLYRGAANRLDLASGDSLNIVSGTLGIGNTSTTYKLDITPTMTAGARDNLRIVGQAANGVAYTQAMFGASPSDRHLSIIQHMQGGVNTSFLAFNQRYDGTDWTQGLWGGSSAIAFESSQTRFLAAVATSDGSEVTVTPTEMMRINNVGQLRLPVTGSSAGLLIGGDTHLYRGAANRLDLASGDSLNIVNGTLQVAGSQIVSASGTLSVPGAYATIGANDSNNGILEIFGDGGGSDNGALLRMYTSADNDSVFDYFSINVFQDDFRIGIGEAGTALSLTNAGQLQLPTTGSSAGLLIGGDTNLYRSAADVLRTDDSLQVVGNGAIGSGASLNSTQTLTVVGSVTDTGSTLYRGISSTLNFNPASPSSASLRGMDGSVYYRGSVAVTGSIIGFTGTVGGITSAGSISSAYGIMAYPFYGVTSTTAVGTAVGLGVQNATLGGATITAQYGIHVSDQTVGTSDYGIAIAGADTQALWVGSGADNTDAANGIAFGASRDTNLYRAGTSILATDDNFRIPAATSLSPLSAWMGRSAGNGIGFDSGQGTVFTSSANLLFQIDSDNSDTVRKIIFSTNGDQFNGGQTAEGTTLGTFDEAGQFALPVTGSSAGLLMGGDANLYRSAANTLATDDSFTVAGNVGIGITSPSYTLDVLGTFRASNTATWSQTGNDLNISGISTYPALAALSSTRVAYTDSNAAPLRTYEFDGTDWVQVGNELNIGGSIPALAALSSTRVAFIERNTDDLRTYEFDGTDWVQVGNGLLVPDITQIPALAALSSTRVAFIDGTNEDLRTYEFDGTDWVQVGNELNISDIGGVPSLAALSSTRVALIGNSNEDLRTYEFDGTDWVQVGNELNIPTAGFRATLAALSSSRIAFIDYDTDDLRTYEFDGTDWVQVGNELNIPNVPNGVVSALASLSPTRVAYIDHSNDDLRTYDFNEPLFAFDASGNVGIGTTTGLNSRLTFGESTTAAGGILFGTDTTLYRSAANTLTVDGSLAVTSTLSVGGDVTPNSATVTTTALTTVVDGATNSGYDSDIFCVTTDDCKIAYRDGTNQDLVLVDCDDATCSTSTVTIIESAIDTQMPSIYCLSSTDCKISYWNSTSSELKMVDCDNSTCSSKTLTTVDDTASVGAYSSIYCLSSTDCKISYYDGSNGALKMADCDDATCSSKTLTTVDTVTSANVGSFSSMHCLSATDCKIAYYDTTNANLMMADCDNATCSSKTLTTVDTSANFSGSIGIHCLSSTDCKIAYRSDSTADLMMADCDNATCSSKTLTIVDSVTSANLGLYASIYCVATDDCKIVQQDGTNQDLVMVDCNNATCSSRVITVADSVTSADTGDFADIYCLSSTDCKISYIDDTASPDNLMMADCGGTDCSTGGVTGFNLGSSTFPFASIYAGAFYGKNTTISSFDLAEEYYSADTLEPGEIVSVYAAQDGEENTRHDQVARSAGVYEETLMGIVSTQPGITLADWQQEDRTGMYPIALAGRVPVKVSNENGDIKPGDAITSSSVPGVGMKATQPGTIVGIALTGFESDKDEEGEEGDEADIITATVTVFVNTGYHMPGEFFDALAEEGVDAEQAPLVAMLLNAFKGLVLEAQKVVADVFVGDKAQLNEIELRDKSNGDIYCIYVDDGQFISALGACDEEGEGQQQATPAEQEEGQEEVGQEEGQQQEVPANDALQEPIQENGPIEGEQPQVPEVPQESGEQNQEDVLPDETPQTDVVVEESQGSPTDPTGDAS